MTRSSEDNGLTALFWRVRGNDTVKVNSRPEGVGECLWPMLRMSVFGGDRDRDRGDSEPQVQTSRCSSIVIRRGDSCLIVNYFCSTLYSEPVG